MDEDESKPRIVSSRTDAELELDRCLRRIDRATRQLAGNMIRVVRGAGQPYDLFDQVAELYQLMANAPPETTVGDITGQMQQALESGLDRDDDDDDYRYQIQEIERGSLRMVAARLLQTPLQVTVGRRDFYDALQSVLRIRDERREARRREEAAYRASLRQPKRKASKPKPKPRQPISPGEPLPVPRPEVRPKVQQLEVEERPTSTAEFMKRRKLELTGSEEIK